MIGIESVAHNLGIMTDSNLYHMGSMCISMEYYKPNSSWKGIVRSRLTLIT